MYLFNPFPECLLTGFLGVIKILSGPLAMTVARGVERYRLLRSRMRRGKSPFWYPRDRFTPNFSCNPRNCVPCDRRNSVGRSTRQAANRREV